MGELIDKLMNYENEGIYPFHMPGHKRNIDVFGYYENKGYLSIQVLIHINMT